MADQQTVGFIGLGNMGAPMARNLIRAGLRVIVYDQDAGRRHVVADEHQCVRADGPADFSDADFLVTMLPTGEIVRKVLLEQSGGFASHLRSSCVLIDMSSSDPTGTRELGAELARRKLALVDAPVSGGVAKAVDGSLSIMLGGDDEEAIERATPVVDAMSARVFRTGPLGSGHAMKALNNYVAAAGFTAAAEALVVGRRFGLDPGVLVNVLNASTGRNFSTEYTLTEHVLSGSYATGFSLGLMTKDVGLAAGLADAMGMADPLARDVHARLSEAVTGLGPDCDHSRAVSHWEGGRPPDRPDDAFRG